MTLLSFAELSTFAPTLADLTQPEFDLLAGLAQSVAESALGANRPLEPTAFVENKDINQSVGSLQLAYWPVVNVTQVRVRTGQQRTRTRRGIGAGEWRVLTPDEYFLDFDGQLHLHSGTTHLFTSVSRRGYSYYRSEDVSGYTQVEISYTSGFDPADAGVIVTELKRSLGVIAGYLDGTAQKALGVKKIRRDKEYDVEFAQFSGAGSTFPGLNNSYNIPELYLLPFRKYLPRGGIF